MAKPAFIATCAALLFLSLAARAQGASEAPKAAYEPELALRVTLAPPDSRRDPLQ